MWNSLLDQIQQRIDDAVELLGDDEENLVDDAPTVEGTAVSSSKDLVLRQQPLSSSSNEDQGSGVERWGGDELSELKVSPAVPGPLLDDPAEMACVSPAPPAPLSPLPTPRLSEVTRELVPAALPDPGDECPSVSASPVCLPPSEVAGQQHSPRHVCATSPPGGLALERQDESAPSDLGGLAAPPSHGTLLSKSPPPEATEVHNSLPPHPAGAAAMTTDPPSVSSADRSLIDSGPSSPAQLVITEPSPPGTSAMVGRESSDLGQLLRFQEQLAKEMENVTTLQSENAFLKDRISVLEEELANATSTLARTGDDERHVSLLIEKLGKEKERHKAVAGERSKLRERVQVLENALEEYRVREDSWRSNQDQERQSYNTAQKRIAELEKDAHFRNALVDKLTTQLNEAKQANGVLEGQIEELRVSYATQLDTVKESSSDTVDQLRQQVEQLNSSLQNLFTEYATRVSELEHEIQSASMRAHHAEVRLSEMQFGSVSTLQDLRTELEDYQRSSAAWKAEAQKTRDEYTELLDQYASLKRSRAEVEADFRDRLSVESNTVLALRRGISEWEERYVALEQSVGVTQAEIAEQRKTIMQLESTIQRMNSLGNEGLNQLSSEVIPRASAAPERAPSLERSQSLPHPSGQPGGRLLSALPPNPFVGMERSPWGDSTDRRTRDRLQQEVLRQSAELERLRVSLAEAEVWKDKYNHLQAEHDLLLQLYGQLEEHVRVLRKSATAGVQSAPGSLPVADAS